MASDQIAYLRVKIESADVSTHVWSLDVEDVDRGSDMATLILDDPGSTASDALQEGERVEIELGWETEHALVFVGCVTAVEATARNHTTSRVKVRALDLSHVLTRSPVPDAPRQHVGTLEEVLTTLLEPYTLPLGRVTISPMPSWTEEEPLLQRVDQNDWEFVQDLAEEYRARAFVEVNVEEGDSDAVRERGGSARLYFMSEQALLEQEPMGRLHYCRGHGRLLEFNYSRVASGASPSASVTVTNPDTGEAEALAGESLEEAPAPAAAPDRASDVAAVLGDRRSEDYEAGVQMAADAEVQPADMRAVRTEPGLPSSPELAERRIQQDRTRILGFHGRGVAMGTVFLRAKGAVEIEGLSSWAAGRWYVHRVNHLIQRTRVDDDTALTFRSRFVATR